MPTWAAGGGPRGRVPGGGGGDRRSRDARGAAEPGPVTRRPGPVPPPDRRRARQRRRRAPGGGPDHPQPATRGAPRPRPVAPLPAAPRPSGGRLSHPRRAGGGPGSPLLPRAGVEPHRPEPCCSSRPIYPTTSKTSADSKARRSKRCSATTASSNRPWGSSDDENGVGDQAVERPARHRCGCPSRRLHRLRRQGTPSAGRARYPGRPALGRGLPPHHRALGSRVQPRRRPAEPVLRTTLDRTTPSGARRPLTTARFRRRWAGTASTCAWRSA